MGDALDFYRYTIDRARQAEAAARRRDGLSAGEESEDHPSDDGIGDMVSDESWISESECEPGIETYTESEEDSSSSSPSVDSAIFLDEHNDLCEVCDGTGELLCCATCNLVFHRECYRPVLKTEPPDNWSCAYCDEAGATKLKRDSRERKRSSRGVREMDKMAADLRTKRRAEAGAEAGAITKSKTEGDGGEGGESSTSDNRADAGATAGSTPKMPWSSPSDKSGSKKIPKGAEMPLVHSQMTPDDLTPRRRRQRKPPTLFDPGDGTADSEWSQGPVVVKEIKTIQEGVPNGKKLKRKLLKSSKRKASIKKKATEERKVNKKKRAKENAKRDEKQRECIEAPELFDDKNVDCTYCYDNPRIPVCMFCACRICFSKANSESTLLCDSCDAEYHMRCLDPPLESMPAEDVPWFCPSCNNEKIKKEKTASARKAKAVSPASSSVPKNTTSPGKNPAPISTVRKRDFQSSGEDSETMKRPKCSPQSSSSVASSPAAPRVSAALQKSRSGRTVKRKEFHDEIEEGCQHLASPARVVNDTGEKTGKISFKESASKIARDDVTGKVGSGPRSTPMPSSRLNSPSASSSSGVSSGAANVTDAIQVAKLRGPETAALSDAEEGVSASLSGQAPPKRATKSPSNIRPIPTHLIPLPKIPPGLAPGQAAAMALPPGSPSPNQSGKQPRRKPGARECMQMSRRFGESVISHKYMNCLLDYSLRGKVEHLVRMRERLDDHSRFLEVRLAELHLLIKQNKENESKRRSALPTAVTPSSPALLQGLAEGMVGTSSSGATASAPSSTKISEPPATHSAPLSASDKKESSSITATAPSAAKVNSSNSS